MTKSHHPLYPIWNLMVQRCTNTNNERYQYYGGRGITVCDRWLNSFEAFVSDMGHRPNGLTLERRNTNGNYEPSNCCWATHSAQMLNRRFYINPTSSLTPYIHKPKNKDLFKVTITITKKSSHQKYFKTLQEAEAHRDICIFERDFLISRKLTY